MAPDSDAEIPPELPPIDAAGRWRAMVERRRVQMDAAYARAGIASSDYWGRRARSYRAATHLRHDPFVDRVIKVGDGDSTVIDVGCGPGRHTLALAPHVRHVTAVDPSPAMLSGLREDLAEGDISNVSVVEAGWMDADVGPTDITICSHVLYPIADVVPFIEKLESVATRLVFVYLRADPIATDFGLWSEFHGMPLQRQPTHRELFNVLAEMGIMTNVEIVATPFAWSFESVDDAVEQSAGSLCLRDDDITARDRLRALISERFTESDGRLYPQIGRSRSAIFSWTPRHVIREPVS